MLLHTSDHSLCPNLLDSQPWQPKILMLPNKVLSLLGKAHVTLYVSSRTVFITAYLKVWRTLSPLAGQLSIVTLSFHWLYL